MTVASALTNALLAAGAGPLGEELFGRDDSGQVPWSEAARAIVAAARVAGDPRAVVLVRVSSGIVVGFDLVDGSRIVVKVHRSHTGDRLNGVLRAQRRLVGAGFPVAAPLVDAPLPIGTGWGLVETWHAEGSSLDVRPRALRSAVAVALHDIVTALDADDFPDLRLRWTGSYPPPHSPVFDFSATAAGSGWIDHHNNAALAVKARLTSCGVGRPVVAHSDLRPENILLSCDHAVRVSAIYDLESLVTDAEPWVVGGVARAFSTDWSNADPMIPEIDEIVGFISDYEVARMAPFTRDERALARAGVLHALAYSARCEHALFPDGSPAPWGPGWRSLLRLWAGTL